MLELDAELLSLGTLDELEDTAELELTLTLELELVGAPSLVCVVVFTTTLVALNANTSETIANGVINGGVRYAIVYFSFNSFEYILNQNSDFMLILLLKIL